MVLTEIDRARSKRLERSATLAYLESRVREEADAAARARTMEATLGHLGLAARYAECLTECSSQSTILAGQAWVEEHRLW